MNLRHLSRLFSENARRGLVLAALFALGLAGVCVARAQSNGGSAVATAKSSHASAGESAPALKGAPSKGPSEGPSEGIQLHGHWVIEVKNPDGKVTARREFENAIQPAGMSYLASLLAGNNSPGPLSILLDGAGSVYDGVVTFGGGIVPNPPFVEFTPSFTNPRVTGPCPPLLLNPVGNSVAGPWMLESGPSCLITATANSSGYAGVLSGLCLAAQQQYANYNAGVTPPLPPPCSTNLSVTAPTLTQSNFGNGLSAQITLNGSVTVSPLAPSGNIGDVETVYEACDNNSTSAGCTNSVNVQSLAQQTGVNSVAVNVFTMKILDPQPVAYSPGQIIAVTVQISFSSP